MKTVKLFFLLILSLIFIESCNNKQTGKTQLSSPVYPPDKYKVTSSPEEYANTEGYWDNGKLITEFDCPDDESFPPIDLKTWLKTPAVNGRFPTYEETMNGTSIHHYGEKENPNIKPYKMTLPKLAYHYNPLTKTHNLVVVIQIAQTAQDTVVGFRYLTGGCGGSRFRDYHFLTDEEVRKIVGL